MQTRGAFRVAVVPEPASFAMVLGGLLLLGGAVLRRRHRA
jgi:hypothetical protein